MGERMFGGLSLRHRAPRGPETLEYPQIKDLLTPS